MGVNTARIDTYAFALGSGIAGLAGCALSQVGNVGPDLGQGYIVDLHGGGAGRRGPAGRHRVCRAGPGHAEQVPRRLAGPCWPRSPVLVFIIVFIQKRPQGIFAMKGRAELKERAA
jgi:urea transport system permease protein